MAGQDCNRVMVCCAYNASNLHHVEQDMTCTGVCAIVSLKQGTKAAARDLCWPGAPLSRRSRSMVPAKLQWHVPGMAHAACKIWLKTTG
jgi:hypothetical protein